MKENQKGAAWPIIGMSVEEAAASLRVNTRTVLDLIRRGGFPARKVGVERRISPAALEAWLAEARTEPRGRED